MLLHPCAHCTTSREGDHGAEHQLMTYFVHLVVHSLCVVDNIWQSYMHAANILHCVPNLPSHTPSLPQTSDLSNFLLRHLIR